MIRIGKYQIFLYRQKQFYIYKLNSYFIIFFLFHFLQFIQPDDDNFYNLGDVYLRLGKEKEALERLILILFNFLVLRIAGN